MRPQDALVKIRNVHKVFGIVMVTHDPHAAASARRVLHLDKGQLSAEVAA